VDPSSIVPDGGEERERIEVEQPTLAHAHRAGKAAP
jgi:hypothetical protein